MSWMLALQAAQWLAGVSAQKQQEKAQINALKKTAAGYVQQMNWSFQNYEMARQSAFAAAIEDMTKTRIQAQRQYGSVSAAVNEDLVGGGRTADALKRNVRNMEAQATASIQSNFEAKNNEINLNKIAQLVSTQNAIKSLPSVQRKNNLSYLLDGAKMYFGAKNASDVSELFQQGASGKHTYSYDLFDPNSVFNQNPSSSFLNIQHRISNSLGFNYGNGANSGLKIYGGLNNYSLGRNSLLV